MPRPAPGFRADLVGITTLEEPREDPGLGFSPVWGGECPETGEDTQSGCLPEIRTEMLERETGFEPATFSLGS